MSDLPAGMSYVRVTNGLNEKIFGRHNGIDMVWRPGESHDITLLSAEHLFGFGLDDKRRSFMHLGWLRSTGDMDKAMEKLSKISFEEVHQVFTIPAKKPSKKANKLGNARSLVNAGGADGESSHEDSPDDRAPDSDEADADEAEVI